MNILQRTLISYRLGDISDEPIKNLIIRRGMFRISLFRYLLLLLDSALWHEW
jgi:hypothetical protein